MADRLIRTLLMIILTMAGCLAPTYNLPIIPEELPQPAYEALISDPDGVAVHVTVVCSVEDASVIGESVTGWYLQTGGEYGR